MCQAKRPTVQAAPTPTKTPAPLATPDQIYGDNQSASIRAGASGRDSLRIDLGSAPDQTPAPTENDQVRDMPTEEAAARDRATAQAQADAAAAKKAKKSKYNLLKRDNFIIGGANPAQALTSDLQANLRYSQK